MSDRGEAVISGISLAAVQTLIPAPRRANRTETLRMWRVEIDF